MWFENPHGNKVRRWLPQKSTALPQTYMGQTDRVLALMLTFFWGGSSHIIFWAIGDSKAFATVLAQVLPPPHLSRCFLE